MNTDAPPTESHLRIAEPLQSPLQAHRGSFFPLHEKRASPVSPTGVEQPYRRRSQRVLRSGRDRRVSVRLGGAGQLPDLSLPELLILGKKCWRGVPRTGSIRSLEWLSASTGPGKPYLFDR